MSYRVNPYIGFLIQHLNDIHDNMNLDPGAQIQNIEDVLNTMGPKARKDERYKKIIEEINEVQEIRIKLQKRGDDYDSLVAKLDNYDYSIIEKIRSWRSQTWLLCWRMRYIQDSSYMPEITDDEPVGGPRT